MIEGNVRTLLEGEPVDAVGGIEHTIDKHAVHVEIRLYLIFGDVQQLLLHLGRIVETVVRLQVEVGTCCLAGIFFDIFRLSICLWRVLRNKILQESIDIVGRFCHCIIQRIGRIVGIAHNLGFLGTQLSHFAHDSISVVLISTVCTVDAGLIDLLTQVAVVQVGEDGLLRSVDDDDGIGSLAATCLGILGALGDVGLRESCQVFLLIDPYHGIVHGSLQQVAPLLLQVRDAQVDFLHACHLIIGQKSTLTYEVLVDLIC